MTVIDDRTANRYYQKPNQANNLVDDVARLRAWADAADADIATALAQIAQRALAIHSHGTADVTGLDAALGAKLDGAALSSLALTLVAATTAPAMRSVLGVGSVGTKDLSGFGAQVFKGDGTFGSVVGAMIAANTVTNDKLSATASTVKGALASGGVADLTPAQLKTLLAIAAADISDGGALGRQLLQSATAAAAKAALAISAADVAGALAFAPLGEVTNVTGVNTVNFGSSILTKDYKLLLLTFHSISHGNASSQAFEVLISGDGGSSFSPTGAITQPIAASDLISGHVFISRASSGAYVFSSSIPYGNTLRCYTPVLTLPGGAFMNHLRIATTGGNYDAGDIRLWGMG